VGIVCVCCCCNCCCCCCCCCCCYIIIIIGINVCIAGGGGGSGGGRAERTDRILTNGGGRKAPMPMATSYSCGGRYHGFQSGLFNNERMFYE